MDDIVYRDMIQQEKKHWWFKARREILDVVLDTLILPKNSNILEIGCGTGGNIELLQKYGNVKAVEMNKFAFKYAQKTGVEVRQGYMPNKFPYKEKFDLICMFDVLEHIEEDEETLSVIYNHLNPNGKLIITVPAHQWLYGSHDKLVHHKRRYTKKELIYKCKNNDFKITKIGYFNTFLFPLIALARLIDRVNSSKNSIGYDTPTKLFNAILFNIFRSEKKLLKYKTFPFGTSIIAIMKT